MEQESSARGTMSPTQRKSLPHAFVKGQPGGPGRPQGSRSRLSETMLALIHADVAEHGAAVLAEVRQSKPHVWLQVIASLMPRQVAVEHVSPLVELSDSELEDV